MSTHWLAGPPSSRAALLKDSMSIQETCLSQGFPKIEKVGRVAENLPRVFSVICPQKIYSTEGILVVISIS
jgi:hypothetical protein